MRHFFGDLPFLEMNAGSVCVSDLTQVVTLLENLSASSLVSDKSPGALFSLLLPCLGLSTLCVTVIISGIAQEQINLLFKRRQDRESLLVLKEKSELKLAC